MEYYIAYGSNLNKRQMKYRCPEARPVGTALLKDWRLMFKGSLTGSYLTIEPHKGAKTPVAIWEVSNKDIANLDVYEGCPHFYYKTLLPVHVIKPDGTEEDVEAFVYIMCEERKYGTPTRSYLETCSEGYADFGFNKNILKNAYRRTVDEVWGCA